MTLARDLTECAQLANRLVRLESTADRDGRALSGRIRLHMAGQPKAAAYDGDRVSGFTSSDPTGDAAIRPDVAAADLVRLRHLASIAMRALDQAVTIAAHYTPRPATEKERREVDAANDPGCDSCARIDASPGIPKWEPRHPGLKVCQWCYRWETRTGAQPPVDLLERHHAGYQVRLPA